VEESTYIVATLIAVASLYVKRVDMILVVTPFRHNTSYITLCQPIKA